MRRIGEVGVGILLLGVAGCGGPASSPPLVHTTLGPFTFDRPAAWVLVPTGNPSHYETIFGFLVAPPASASETCGSDYIPGGGACNDTVATPPGSVVVTFREFVSGACHPTAVDAIAADLANGWTSTTIAELKAAANRPALGSQPADWTWDVAETGSSYCVVAEVRARFGASSASIGPAVDAVVASLQVAPPKP